VTHELREPVGGLAAGTVKCQPSGGGVQEIKAWATVVANIIIALAAVGALQQVSLLNDIWIGRRNSWTQASEKPNCPLDGSVHRTFLSEEIDSSGPLGTSRTAGAQSRASVYGTRPRKNPRLDTGLPTVRLAGAGLRVDGPLPSIGR